MVLSVPPSGSMLDYALAYLAQGYPVIPTRPLGKVPLIQWREFETRKPDESEVREWWGKQPEANLAFVTGDVSDLALLDIDGDEGVKALREAGVEIPPTLVAKSPHGWHAYYRKAGQPIRNRAAVFGEGSHVDIRGEGGIVVVPPSKLPDADYRWQRVIDPHKAPEWMVKPDLPKVMGDLTEVEHWVNRALSHGAETGNRNQLGIRLAGYLYSKRLPRDVIETMLVQYASKCEPPLEAWEIRRIIANARAFEERARALGIEEVPVPLPIGDGWRLQWERYSVAMEFRNLHRDKTGLHCSLTVVNMTPGAGRQYGPVSFNLMSIPTRTSLVKSLADRYKFATVEWSTLVDDACVIVDGEQRRGSPMVRLAAVEGEGGDAPIIDPIVLTTGPTCHFADGACLSGDAVLETLSGGRTMQDLYWSGERPVVRSLGPDGPTWIEASPVYRKGEAILHEVKLTNGASFRGTANHRVLTQEGWKRIADLRDDDVLAVFSPGSRRASDPSAPSSEPNLRGSSSDASLSRSRGDDRHYSHTGAGSTDRCCQDYRPGDRPLRLAADTDQGAAPSPVGAPARSPDGLHVGDPVGTAARTHPRPAGHPSRSSSSQGEPWPVGAVSLRASSPPTPRSGSHQGAAPFHRASLQPLPSHADDQLAAASGAYRHVQASLPPSGQLTFCTIASIRYSGLDDYYDLHVPVTNNYLANGVWHHNSGKTWLSIAQAVTLATGEDWGLGTPARRVRVGVGDAEWSGSAWKERARRFLLGSEYKLEDLDIFYVRMRGALRDNVEWIRQQIAEHELGFYILDSVAPLCGGDVNENEVALGYMNALDALEIGTLSIAHNNKQGDRKKPFGSAFFYDKFRSIWYVRKQNLEDGMLLTLEETKPQGEPNRPVSYRFTFEGRGERASVERQRTPVVGEGSQAMPLRERIIEVLRRSETAALTVDEVYARLGAVDPRMQNQVRARMVELQQAKVIGRLKTGEACLLSRVYTKVH